MVGFQLQKTVSEHGSVARGVCQVDEQGFLTGMVERTKIYLQGWKHCLRRCRWLGSSPGSHGYCFHEPLWIHCRIFLPTQAEIFGEFIKEHINNPKAEFFIPLAVDKLISAGNGKDVCAADTCFLVWCYLPGRQTQGVEGDQRAWWTVGSTLNPSGHRSRKSISRKSIKSNTSIKSKVCPCRDHDAPTMYFKPAVACSNDSLCYSQALPEWQNPDVVQVNREAAHATRFSFESEDQGPGGGYA